MSSRQPNDVESRRTDKLDFDANRQRQAVSEDSSVTSAPHLLPNDEDLLSNVVDGIIERKRERLKIQVTRYLSFASAILSW